MFPDFIGWAEGYGAFTYTIKEKEALTAYIKKQEKHHRIKSFRTEYKELLNEHDIKYQEKYLF